MDRPDWGFSINTGAGGLSTVDAAAEERGIQGEELWAPPSATAGIAVNRRSALKLAAYFAGVNVLSTDVACLPLGVYRRAADDSRESMREDARHELLTVSPDGETTSMRWRQAMMGHALMFRGGYAEIVRNGRGQATRLVLLDPTTIEPVRDETGRLFYRLDGGRARLPASDVIHVAGLGFDGVSGYDLLTYGSEVFGLGLALQQFAASFVAKGARLSGVLETPKILKPEAIKFLRAGFEDLHAGSANAGRVALLEQGVTFRAISSTPEEAQHLQSREFVIKEVCRLLRIPPHKLMEFGEAHLSNVEASNLDYLMTSLMPWLEAIEQEITFKLFTPAERRAGYYVEHNMNALLRGDMKARGEFYKTLRDLGVLSPNQIAQKENLERIGPEGDIRLVPLNMISLELAGKPDGGDVAPATPTADPVDDQDELETEDDQVEPALDGEGPPEDVAPAAERVGGWMDGNQLFSLKRLVNDAALGELPAETSRAALAAAFPGIPSDQLEAIYGPLEGFTPASIQPKVTVTP
jgi:HK97 family phage portal protein